MIKKMLLLASMALAVIAFAAPAVAQAEAHWTNSDGTVGGEGNGANVHFAANITSVIGGTLRTTAPITLAGEVWNDAGSEMGEGVISERTAGTGHVVGIPTAICHVEVTLLGDPWTLTLTTDTDLGAGTNNATVDLNGVKFLNHYSHGCVTASGGAIPSTGGATGTVTATAETSGASVTLDLEATQDLTLYNPATTEHVSGSAHVGLESDPDPIVLTAAGGIGVEQH